MKAKKGEGERGERFKKAIIGIALAAVMLASVFASVMPTASALPLPDASYNGLYNNITLQYGTPSAVSVLIGQDLWLHGANSSPATIKGDPTSSATAGKIYTADSAGKFDTSVMTTEGYYYVNPVGGSSTIPPDSWEAKLAVTNPVMSLDLKVAGTSVSTITEGSILQADFVTNLDAKDMVSLVIIDPDGNTIKATTNPTQYFDRINVSWIHIQYGVGAGINTTDWMLGTYTFKVVTKKDGATQRGARGLEYECNVKTLAIITGEISIEAERTSTVELERVKLTVLGVAGHTITIATSDSAHTVFPGGLEDNPSVDTTGFTDVIDADGKRIYAVCFNKTGSYTITVTDMDMGDDDAIDITVSEKGVTFDMPTTVVIGEKLTVRGTANTGDLVQIAVDDYICNELKKLVLAGNGEFEKEIDTSSACSGAFSVPGCVRLKAFIDTPFTSGEDVSNYTDDGSVAILVLETHLNATITKATAFLGDSFEVYGNASSNYVEIVAIRPEGGNGTGMDGLYGTTIYMVPTFCNYTNYNFYKKIKVDSDADNGNYTIIVLTPGMDKAYGNSEYSYIDSILDLDGEGPELGTIDVSNKTQEEIVAIIGDIIYAAGSDDFMWIGNIIVAQLDTFDTGEGSYPSIMGTHNGTITIQRMYTYPCTGTGGHSEYAGFYDQNGTKIGEGHWKGYQSGDYHYITFDTPLTLEIGKTYNYTIKTGSYPQIIHARSKDVTGGVINCTEFIDANGKEYNDWIPAIKLE